MTTDDLTWMPAWRIRELILAREVSCLAVTEHFLDRIEELNKSVRAMENVDAAGARPQAVNADRRLAEGEEAGPLLGIPVAVKANMRVEGLPHGVLRSAGPRSRPRASTTSSSNACARPARSSWAPTP